MDITNENIILLISILLFVSILASKTSGKIGIPSLVLFLAVGILAGSEGIGNIEFDDPLKAQIIGIVALTLILFSGGLDTRWENIKPVTLQGVSLSTIGVFFTTLAVGIFAYFVLNFTIWEGMLLGAIVSSTDAAAVFSILRSKSIGLKNNLRPTLELESGSNDPMAYFLTISFTFLLVNPQFTLINLIPLFLTQMIFGGIAGFLMGKAMVFIINKVNLEYDGLYPVLTLSLVLFTYSATDFINGNGFLAVYVSAVILGNNDFIHKRSLMKFYDGVAWLMQIMMFLTLGLLVFPSEMVPLLGVGFVISLFLIFVARPLGVFISLLFFKIDFKDKLFISWVGLRGAVPIVFATYPLLAGVERADIIFNIVFFIVLTSVLLQGTTLSLVAKWLNLNIPESIRKKYAMELEFEDNAKNELFDVQIPFYSPAVGKSIVQLGFPQSSLIIFINRKGKYITPSGATVIEPEDKLKIMTDSEEELEKINASLGLTKTDYY
ncbi:potassium/proton antiporter [soil metagenome]